MFKWHFIVTVLLMILTGSLNWAAVSGDADSLVHAQAVLNNVIQSKAKIDQLTEPGTIRSRRAHVSKENRDAVKSLAREVEQGLSWLKLTLTSYLVKYRTDRLSGDEARVLQGALSTYVRFVEEAGQVKLVFDDESIWGAFGRSRELFDVRTFQIEVTRFDFATGFVSECRDDYGDGLIVYRDPTTGEIIWKSSYKSALAIIGTDPSGKPIVEDQCKTGISSALNPVTGKWVVNAGGYKTPNASVWNPALQRVETRSGGYNTGIGGVYNPLTQKVQWETSYKTGVAGYFDENQNKVIWHQSYKSGVACVTRSHDGRYTFSNSFYGGENDDDD